MNYRFPIATFSATIAYGGNDDMYGDIIDSLKMKTGEYEYISPMRRDDIIFDIKVLEKENDYLKEKEIKVLKSLDELYNSNIKTVVYFPYKKQIDEYLKKYKRSSLVSRYHGGMERIEKETNVEQFKLNETSMIFATKAFGMGIDIDDIKCVYHYAPTGNLCDYIQEIGRSGRKKGVSGIAKIDFFENDYRYIKQLFGMSSIRNYQLVETLKKIREIYIAGNNKRNFTVSPDEFCFEL